METTIWRAIRYFMYFNVSLYSKQSSNEASQMRPGQNTANLHKMSNQQPHRPLRNFTCQFCVTYISGETSTQQCFFQRRLSGPMFKQSGVPYWFFNGVSMWLRYKWKKNTWLTGVNKNYVSGVVKIYHLQKQPSWWFQSI